MKNNLQKTFRKSWLSVFGVLVIALSLSQAYGQCAFSGTAFGGTTAPGTIGTTNTASTCNYYGEYSPITGFSTAFIYSLNINTGGYITVFDLSNNPVAFGPAPLSFIPPSNGNYNVQWNANAACGTDVACHTTTVTNTSASAACTDPATAGTAVSTPAMACPSQNITLSLTGSSVGSGLTYQWQSSPDGVAFSPIGGAINSTLTTTQSATTYYNCIVTCSAGTPVTSSNVQVNMNSFSGCYCTPTSAGGACVTNVTINTINNTTPGCSAGNYSQQAATTMLQQGVTYNFSVSCDAAAITSVWFDFNQNGIYEVSEWTQPYTNATTGTVSVTVPLGAILGTTGMRVRSRLAGNINGAGDACTAFGSGEDEDYLVTIISPPTCPQPTAFSLVTQTTSGATVQWTAGGAETQWEIEYGPIGFTLGTGTTVSGPGVTSPESITGLAPNAFYQVYVRAICGAGDTSFFTGPVSFNTYGQGLYMDVDNACIPFNDISATGTNNALTDDAEVGVTLPFTLLYQGTIVNQVTIGNNGGIALGSLTAQVAFGNTAMNLAPTGLYPFWDDIGNNGLGVFYQTIGTPGNQQFIVQWNKEHLGATGNDLVYQVIIDQATNEIYFNYDDVDAGNVTYDNGASATVGIAGPSQDIQLSLDNATYLSENTCAHFFYTDCPRPTTLTPGYITPDEVAFSWTAGLSGESDWIVEYGPAGFTPGTGTFLNEPNAFSTITGLVQLTEYDVYIYADCASGDTSVALTYNFTTLPYCSNPATISGNTSADQINAAWNWTSSGPGYNIDNFNVEYGMAGFDLYSGTTYTGTGTNNADTIVNPSFLAGGVYEIYVQAVCLSGDTSTFAGPFTVIMPLTNDPACGAENIATNGTVYTFNNTGATIEAGEAAIAPPATGFQTTDGWGNSTVTATTWFTFTAPASGSIRINGTAINYDGQVAVYEVGDCLDFASFDLEGANDDDLDGLSLAPNFTLCGLTPGVSYFLMHDPFGATGTYSLSISAINLNAGASAPVTEICSGSSVNLFNTSSGEDAGGIWSSDIPAVNISITGSTFNSTGLAYDVFDFEYMVVNGCAADSVTTQVEVFGPSNAGDDGTIAACKNEPINLLSGLNGTADLNGTWYDPSNTPLPGSTTTTANVSGSYTFDYITDNGVCPADTAAVVVVVGTCDFTASIAEEAFAGVSLFPNPSEGIVYISTDKTTADFDYVVTDANGRTIAKATQAIKSATTSSINLNAVETGIYFIRLSNSEAQKTFRVVIR